MNGRTKYVSSVAHRSGPNSPPPPALPSSPAMSAEPALSVCATVRACLQPAAAAPVSRSRTLSGTSVAMVRIGHGSSARPAVRAQVRRVQPAGGRVTGHTTQKGQHEGGLGAPAALVAWGMGAVLTCLGAVPPSTDTCVIVPPVRASGCIGGVYHAYSERFPPQLEKHVRTPGAAIRTIRGIVTDALQMSKDQFRDLIEEINDTLDVHFPCVRGRCARRPCLSTHRRALPT